MLGRVTQYYNEDDTPQISEYEYDNNNQLLLDGSLPEHEFAYDLGGNRTSTDGVTSTPAAGNRLQNDGTNTYQYDEEGNLKKRTNTTTGVVTNYSWDHRNRLVAVQVVMPGYPAAGSYNVSYTYDALDRRVAWQWVTYLVGQFGILYPDQIYRQEFVYDGDDVVFDFESLNLGPYALARRYLHGPAVDQVFAQENLVQDIADADRVYWLLDDRQGSIRDIVDHTGARLEHYKYTAFGQLVEGDATLTRYLYTGREFDLPTGLQYNRGRWYDASTGRFLTEDPTGFGGGDANLYRYVGNSPTNARDPSGMWASGTDYSTAGGSSPSRHALFTDGKYLRRQVLFAKSPWSDLKITGIRPIYTESEATLNHWREGYEAIGFASVLLPGGQFDTAVTGISGFCEIPSLGPRKSQTREVLPSEAKGKTFVDLMAPAEAARYRAYWESRPSNAVRFRDQAAPGTRRILDAKISKETGEVYVRESIYDPFGQRIGTNDYTTHGRGDHTLPHYHTRDPITGQRAGPFPGLHPETPR